MATQSKLVTYDDDRNLQDDGKRYEIRGRTAYDVCTEYESSKHHW